MKPISLSKYLVSQTIVFLALWQVFYTIAIISNFPSLYTIVAFLVTFTAITIYIRLKLKIQVSISYSTLFISIVLMLIPFFFYRNTFDDINYWHRGFIQNFNLNSPFFFHDLIHETKNNLSILSLPHQLASFEYLFSFFGFVLFRNDPFMFVHNLVPAFFIIFFISILNLWADSNFTQKKQRTLFLVFFLLFMLVDNSNTFTYGHASILRFWLGKIIYFTSFIPLIIYVYAYENEHKALKLFLINLAGVSLTGSSSILSPLLIFALIVTTNFKSSISFARTVQQFRTYIFMILPHILVVSSTLIYNRITDFSTEVWLNSEWPGNFYILLKQVWSNDIIVVRNLFIIFSALFILPKKFVPKSSLFFLILVFNPLFFHIVEKLITRDGYWRLAYCIPVPLMFALSATLCTTEKKINNMKFPAALNVIVRSTPLIILFLGFEKTIFTETRTKVFKKDFFHTNIEPYIYTISFKLKNYSKIVLLADFQTSTHLPLIDEKIKLYASRRTDTYTLFLNSKKQSEGILRNRIQSEILCRDEIKDPTTVKAELTKINAIFIKNSCYSIRRDLLSNFTVVLQLEQGTLLIKN